MAQQLDVIAVPSINYGKFLWLYKPNCHHGQAFLATLMEQFKYKVPIVKGKPQPRSTFAPEWIQWAQDKLGTSFKIVESQTIEQMEVGTLVPVVNEITVDFSAFL